MQDVKMGDDGSASLCIIKHCAHSSTRSPRDICCRLPIAAACSLNNSSFPADFFWPPTARPAACARTSTPFTQALPHPRNGAPSIISALTMCNKRGTGTSSTLSRCRPLPSILSCSAGPTSTSAAAVTPSSSTRAPLPPPHITAGSFCCIAIAPRRRQTICCAESVLTQRSCVSFARFIFRIKISRSRKRSNRERPQLTRAAGALHIPQPRRLRMDVWAQSCAGWRCRALHAAVQSAGPCVRAPRRSKHLLEDRQCTRF